MRIVLASNSERRIDLLKSVGFEFLIRSHSHSEEHDEIKDPESFVIECSRKKAESSQFSSDELIIGADTIVFIDGQIIGKPSSKDDAWRMLVMMSGKVHTVYTGLTLVYGDISASGSSATKVYFRELAVPEIDLYLERSSYMDKAGAYAVQEEASMFVKKIEGDFFNIIGFPLVLFSELFLEVSGQNYYDFVWKSRKTKNNL